MWEPEPLWAQQSSFIAPVAPPTSMPGDEPLICISINQEWIPFVCGALLQLAQPGTWDMAGVGFSIYELMGRVTDLIASIGIAAACAAPACAGMDPAHRSTIAAHVNSSSVVDSLVVGAGATIGGIPIAYSAASVAIPDIGLFMLSVSASGVLSLTTPLAVPLGNVLLASVQIDGNGGEYSGAPPGMINILYPYRAATSGIVTFAWGSPVAIPTPALIDSSQYNNSHTPAGDSSGFYIYDPSVPNWYPFNVPAIGAVPAPSSYPSPLGIAGLQFYGDQAGAPTVISLVMPALTSNDLPDGVSYNLAFNMPPWPAFSPVATNYPSNLDWIAYETPDTSPYGSPAGFVLGPVITVTRVFGSC